MQWKQYITTDLAYLIIIIALTLAFLVTFNAEEKLRHDCIKQCIQINNPQPNNPQPNIPLNITINYSTNLLQPTQ